jgi:hypothetical protein
MRADPGAAAVVPPIEAAFTDAARTAGLVAAGFISLGLLFSLLLPASSARALEPAAGLVAPRASRFAAEAARPD